MSDDDKHLPSDVNHPLFTTDDSGVVIPYDDWAELHGETNSSSLDNKLGTVPLPPMRVRKSKKGNIKTKYPPQFSDVSKAKSFKHSADNIPEPNREMKCKLCGYVTTAGDFKKHIAAFHKVIYQAILEGNYHECPICQVVVKPKNFWKHISSFHSNTGIDDEAKPV